MKTPLAFALGCLTAIAFMQCTPSRAAEPEPYFILGAGIADLKTTSTNDLWYQDGFGHVSAEHSPTYKVGLGLKLWPWLAAELDYRDLGQFNSQALWVGDTPGAAGNYNIQTRRCNGACDPTSSGWQHGSTDGIGLSLVASPDWVVAPLLRLGVFYHRSSFTSSQVWGFDPHTQQLKEFSHDGGLEFNEEKLGPMIGVGVRFSFLDLEYTYFPAAGGPVSPYQDVSTVMLSVRMPL